MSPSAPNLAAAAAYIWISLHACGIGVAITGPSSKWRQAETSAHIDLPCATVHLQLVVTMAEGAAAGRHIRIVGGVHYWETRNHKRDWGRGGRPDVWFGEVGSC